MNEVIGSMQGRVNQRPDQVRAVGVRKLRNRGVIYELNTPEVAT